MSAKKLLTIPFSLLFFLILFYTTSIFSLTYAQGSLLFEDFEDSTDSWKVVYGDWEHFKENETNHVYKTHTSSKNVWSLVVPKDDSFFNLKDYIFKARLQSNNGVDQLLLFRLSESLNSFYSVDLRASGWVDSDNIRIAKTLNGNLMWNDQLESSQIGCNILNNEWYEIEILVFGPKIDVKIKCPGENNFRNIFTKIDAGDLLTGGTVGLAMWSGHWGFDTTKHFDNIEIKLPESDPSFLPLILLPGFGASWNTEAILLGESGDQNKWLMTPFVKEYSNLINTLEGAGYEEGKNFYIFNYDWRQPVSSISLELRKYIDENINTEDKVGLIGHSLGGLVARDYWQNYGHEKVDKLITLGSPHKGVVQAYEALAGGKISNGLGWGSVAANILSLLRAPKYKTVADMIRNEIPSLYDLSPTFDFLYQGRKIVPVSNLFYQNSWLASLNSSISDSLKINYISGNTGENTSGQIIVKNPSALDKMLGLWPDGLPYKYKNEPGDETVLLKSSHLATESQEVFNISHRELPSESESISKILEIIGIDTPVVSVSSLYPINDTLIFLVASPVEMDVTGPSGNYKADNQGMIIVPHPGPGNYEVNLNKKGDGQYHLVVGRLFDNDYWNFYEGIAKSEGTKYIFNINSSNPKENPIVESEKERLIVVLEEINSLESSYFHSSLLTCKSNIVKAIKEVELNNFTQAASSVKSSIDSLFEFRKQNSGIESLNEGERSVEMLADIYGSLLEKSGMVGKNQARLEYDKTSRKSSLSWRKIRLLKRRNQVDDYLLIEYRQGSNLLGKSSFFLKNSEYSKAFSYSYSAGQFYR